ncbi:MAG: hypothetical protein ACREVL_12170, partial [Solimonas sp.]
MLLVMLSLLPGMGAAAEIVVGGVTLEVPAPPGYERVTPKLATHYQIEQTLVPQTNEALAAFYSEADMARIAAGETPDLSRRFTVQTYKALIGRTVSTADFAQLKSIVVAQNRDLTEKLEQLMPGYMQKVNQGLNKLYG